MAGTERRGRRERQVRKLGQRHKLEKSERAARARQRAFVGAKGLSVRLQRRDLTLFRVSPPVRWSDAFPAAELQGCGAGKGWQMRTNSMGEKCTVRRMHCSRRPIAHVTLRVPRARRAAMQQLVVSRWHSLFYM